MKSFILKNKNLLLCFSLFLATISVFLRKFGYFEFIGIKFFYLLFIGLILVILFLAWQKIISFKNSLLITFPSILFLFYSVNNFKNLHYIFDLIIGFWLILTGIFAVKKISEKKYEIKSLNFQENKLENQKKDNKIWTKFNVIFLSIIVFTHLFFALYQSNKTLYVDERLWTYGGEKRIQDFWTNILERDWRSVRVSDKPGVTLTWISGISLFWTKPAEFKNVREFDEKGREDFARMLFLIRLPVIIFTSLSLIFIYFFISKLFNCKVGLISTAFIGLSSLLIGISRMINPDALSWIFIPLTIFVYLIYQKNNEKKYLYLTGIFFGLGLLTKYITNLLLPFFLAEIFVMAVLMNVKKEDLPELFKKKFLDFIAIFILGLIVFYIFYPGVWIELNRLLLATIWSQPFKPIWKLFLGFILFLAFDIFILKLKIFTYLVEFLKKFKKIIYISLILIFSLSIFFVFADVYLGMKPLDFEFFMSSPKNSGKSMYPAIYFSGFYGLIFGICPLILLGILANLFFNLKDFWQNFKNKEYKLNFEKYAIWQISFFILIYFLASTFSGVVPMPRYQIVVYPLAILIGSFGFYEFLKNLGGNFLTNKFIFGFLIVAITSINSMILWKNKPFYFSYNSFFLPQKYIINPKDIGEGNYEIAEILNNLPDAKNLNIWSDRNGVCDLFIGNCSSKDKYDFYITSRGRKSKFDDIMLNDVNSQDIDLNKVLKEIIFGNRPNNFIKIIDNRKNEN